MRFKVEPISPYVQAWRSLEESLAFAFREQSTHNEVRSPARSWLPVQPSEKAARIFGASQTYEPDEVLLIDGAPEGLPAGDHAIVYALAQPGTDGATFNLQTPQWVFWIVGDEVVALGCNAKVRQQDGLLRFGAHAIYAVDVTIDYGFKPWRLSSVSRRDQQPTLAHLLGAVSMKVLPSGPASSTAVRQASLLAARPGRFGHELASVIWDDHWSIMGYREAGHDATSADQRFD